MSNESEIDAEKVFDERKADHKILNAALTLQDAHPDRKVILVTKDINLRLKAKSLNLVSEDYETGKVKDVDDLDQGSTVLERVSSQKISDMYRDGFCEVSDIRGLKDVKANQYYILKSSKNSVLSYYNPETQKMEKVEKRTAYGIRPKNAEQTFALHAITNPDVRLVAIQGVAGTGKTLLALAGALEQRRDFKQIYLARPIVPLSNKDIGYLPGDIKSKLNP